jgi:hypothetical protein
MVHEVWVGDPGHAGMSEMRLVSVYWFAGAPTLVPIGTATAPANDQGGQTQPDGSPAKK